MACDGCDIRLENADMLSNLESKVSHVETVSSVCILILTIFFIGGCNDAIPCVECSIDIVNVLNVPYVMLSLK